MVKQQVRVLVRTRPTAKFASDKVNIKPDENKINIRLKQKTNRHLNNLKQNHTFRFDGILHNSSQEDVFESVALETIKSCFEGYNGTIFCYGQTGAGKTYTMTGPPDNTSDYRRRGLVPRAIEQVMEEVHNRPERSFQLSISYLEIYLDKLTDLLNVNVQSRQSPPKTKLQIVETGKSEIFVRGLKKFPIKDEEDGLALMFEGDTQRAICEHVLNADSSRSHAVFTIYIESRSRVESSGQTTRSKLHLVDLAGSERVKKTKSVGRVLTEAKHINKSLSFLEQVVIALSTPGRSHIPYRQSPLTHFLKDSIGGNSKTTMVANVWCEGRHMEETLGTLKFGTRVMRVSNTAVVNVELNPSMLLTRYERQVKDLKRELAMHDQLKGITEVVYEKYTDEQRLELRKSIWKYIRYEGPGEDELDSSPEAQQIQDEVFSVRNLRQVRETLIQFKLIVRNLENDVKGLRRELKAEKEKVVAAHGGTVPTTTEVKMEKVPSKGVKKTGRGKGGAKGKGKGKKEAQESASPKETKIVVGDVDDQDGFAAGEGIPLEEKKGSKKGVPPSSTSSSRGKLGKSRNLGRKKMEEEEEEYVDDGYDEEELPPPPSKDDAYEAFKTEEGSKGKEIFDSLRENIKNHQGIKKSYIQAGKNMNQQKKEIDVIKGQINRKKLFAQKDRTSLRVNRSDEFDTSIEEGVDGGEEIIDSELLLLYESLKTKKKGYREEYEERKRLKQQLNFIGSRINVMKKKMIVEFEKDYSQRYGTQIKRQRGEEEVDGRKKSSTSTSSWLEREIAEDERKRKNRRMLGKDSDASSSTMGNEDDVLDDGEMFEMLEEKRIMEKDPESYTYYKAFQKSKIQKKRRKGRRRR